MWREQWTIDNRLFFRETIDRTSAGSSLSHKNCPHAEIIKFPEGRPATNPGKIPEFLIRNRPMLLRVLHGLHLPLRKTKCHQPVVDMEIFGERHAKRVGFRRKLRFRDPMFPEERDHSAGPGTPLLRQFAVIEDLGKQGIPEY